MEWHTLLVAMGSLCATALLTGLVRRFLLSRSVLAIPNERSLHEVPTPQGGGIAIVCVTTIALCALAVLGVLTTDVLMAFGGGGVVVAAIGFMDDRRGVSPKARIAVHFAAAFWALLWLGGLPPVPIGDRLLDFGFGGYLLGALGIVWSLNLFNFMDGIDGIAASEATFMALAGAFLAVVVGSSAEVPAIALVLACACAGFLVWNWPPAKIFMGDVGSGYIGYVIALLAIVAANENRVAWLVWLILGAVFFVDATLTLVRRSMRGERVYEAHRSHAYQWLARRWGHRPVTVAVLLVNIAWLLPCAWLATAYPAQAAWITIAALTPVVLAAIGAGVGRSEAGIPTHR
jgi:Fuc2NAc and GlcNAc transferase